MTRAERRRDVTALLAALLDNADDSDARDALDEALDFAHVHCLDDVDDSSVVDNLRVELARYDDDDARVLCVYRDELNNVYLSDELYLYIAVVKRDDSYVSYRTHVHVAATLREHLDYHARTYK